MRTRGANRLSLNLKATTKSPGNRRVDNCSYGTQGPRRSPRAHPTPPPTPPFTPKPSDNWGSIDNVSGLNALKVREILSRGDWDSLCSEAVNCFRRHLEKQGQERLYGLACNISLNRLACGSRNLVLEVAFSNSTYWIVRIRLPGVDNDAEDEVEKAMRSEVATMHLIQERTTIPVATVFGYGTRKDNPFGYPYMFMSVLPGRHLKSNFGSSVPKKHQAKVAEQFAQILHQLNTRMTFDMIGRIWCGESGNEAPSITSFNTVGACGDEIVTYPIGPFSTSLEYFYALRQHENAAVRAGIQQRILGQDDEETWYTACRVFEQTLSTLVHMERVSGPYPLKHMDLHYNNILLDDDYNITGVIDWTAAQTVPRESLPVGVEFIAPPGAPAELVANKAAFSELVRKAWKKKESETKCVCSTARAWAGSEAEFTCVCSIPDILGSTRADLINFSSTLGALRRSVAYAQIVTPLLYGPGFSLDNFKNRGVLSTV